MADRFTAAKTEHEYRAMIVCSVVVFDDYVRVRGDRKEHAVRYLCATFPIVIIDQSFLSGCD